ncbi:MAG: hypothetical protein QG612_2777 [Pseudomonadota bacterium]|nr:hypothetical protein [Pseudomonadota bacterium]
MTLSDLRRLLLSVLLGGLVMWLMTLVHLDLPAPPPASAAVTDSLPEQARAERLQAEGRALWQGAWAMQARLEGSRRGLEGQASRCVRCHGGTALPRALLRQVDGEAGLCRLLREGRRADGRTVSDMMPRYDAAEADCAALWAHLTVSEAP